MACAALYLFAGCGGQSSGSDSRSGSGGARDDSQRATGGTSRAPEAESGRGASNGSSQGGAGSSGGGSTGAAGALAAAGWSGSDEAACPPFEHPAPFVEVRDEASLEEMRGVTQFRGHLVIDGDVTDLSALSCLTSVDGQLSIVQTTKLRSLLGLENLSHIGGATGAYLVITDNRALETLTGLEGLESIASNRTSDTGAYDSGDIEIADNPLLATTNGLARLRRVGRSVEVAQNARLRDLVGLDSLFTVPPLELFSITNNPQVQTCEAERIARFLAPLMVTIVGGAPDRGDGSCEPPFH